MRKILIANRGEIARRIIRTCRQMGIGTVAVFSEPDRDAPFVADADEAVALGGATATESYLSIDKLLAAARAAEADAVHPGYGFLSERAEFAAACRDAGLVFIGPTPEAIEAMGSKVEAKRRAQAAGVPVLPSIEARTRSADELLPALAEFAWPLLIKASAGGGGRGMRIVRRREDFADALALARREAESAFGDGAVFVEPYVEAPRHIEVQILGDAQGHAVHLFERECSIQRRHQKIIEEAPSPVLDERVRAEMGAAAVKLANSIGYTNAGTVEFLFTPEGKFYFLEVNTRLQVEHPATECVTGVDLVRCQILVAQGQPLPEEAQRPVLRGHAIEARVYAEDPRQDYRPMTGRLHRFRFEAGPAIRVESALDDAGTVSPFYDPMLAKVIAFAPTRGEAARRLAACLAGAEIHGLRTNRELLVRVLRHEEFLAGRTDTHFLERNPAAELSAPLTDTRAEAVHAVAAALAGQAGRRARASVLAPLPSGWRNNPSQFQTTNFVGEHGEVRVGYQFSRQGLEVRLGDDAPQTARLDAASAERVDMEFAGVRRTYRVHWVADRAFVDSALGSSDLVELPRFPSAADEGQAGSLVAPFPGVVAEVKVSVGVEVAVGDPLVVIESMKMLHPVSAPHAGKVSEVRVEAAQQVDAGTVLVVIDKPG